jgi:hypothetical protein
MMDEMVARKLEHFADISRIIFKMDWRGQGDAFQLAVASIEYTPQRSHKPPSPSSGNSDRVTKAGQPEPIPEPINDLKHSTNPFLWWLSPGVSHEH